MDLTAVRDHDSRSEQPLWAPISGRAWEASPHVTFGHLTCRAWEAKRASNVANRQKNQAGCKCYFSTALKSPTRSPRPPYGGNPGQDGGKAQPAGVKRPDVSY